MATAEDTTAQQLSISLLAAGSQSGHESTPAPAMELRDTEPTGYSRRPSTIRVPGDGPCSKSSPTIGGWRARSRDF